MKVTFKLCCVLVLSLASNLTVAENDRAFDRKPHLDCIGDYLSNKGAIPKTNYPNLPDTCDDLIATATQQFQTEFKKSLATYTPDESDCLFTEFSKAGLVDFFFKVCFLKKTETITFSQRLRYVTLLDTVFTELDALLASIASKCGVAVEQFDKNFVETDTCESQLFNKGFL